MKRTAEDAQKTRRAILRSSLAAFQREGWRGATFEVIARAADVSRGAVNHHFASKTELLAEALEYGWAEFGEKLFAEEFASASAVDNISGLLMRYIRWLRDDPQFLALVSTTVVVAPQATHSNNAEKADALLSWKAHIERWLSLHSDLPVSKGLVARSVVIFLQGLAVTAVTNVEDLPHSSELEASVDYLVRGFLGLRPRSDGN